MTTNRPAIRTAIRDWLATLAPGAEFTMRHVRLAVGAEPDSEIKRRYREARAELEKHGWQFSHDSDGWHFIDKVGTP